MQYLIEAIEVDDDIQVANLLSSGMNPNGYEDYARVRPLHFAAQYNALRSAYLLLKAGADASCKTIDGLTPLEVARIHKHKEMILLLLQQAKISTRTKFFILNAAEHASRGIEGQNKI